MDNLVRTGDHCFISDGDPEFSLQGFGRKKLPYRLDDIFVYGHGRAFKFGSVFVTRRSRSRHRYSHFQGDRPLGPFICQHVVRKLRFQDFATCLPDTRQLKPIQLISVLAAPQGQLFPGVVSEKA